MSIDQFLLSADTTDLNYPEIRPTLDLNFARTKTLDPRITFTRASGGSYVGADGLIKYAGVNEARFDHDPVTGESLGLLVEESRTNLIRHSSIDGTVGTKPTNFEFASTIEGQSCVVSTDFDFDGNGKCIKHTRGVGGDSNLGYPVNPELLLVSGTTYTFSIYVYIPSSQRSRITEIRFGPDTGFSSITFAFANVNIVDRWQRVTGFFVSTGTFNSPICRVTMQNGAFFYTDAWQMEQGAFPTSYIPTQASTRTRALDTISITGKNFSEWYRQDEGTILSNYITRVPTNANQNNVDFVIENETSTNRIIGWNNFAKTPVFSLVENNIANYVFSGSISKVNIPVKKIIGVKDFDVKMFIGTDALIGDFASGVPDKAPRNLTRMFIGVGNGFSALNGTISRITYFPKRLSNQQLQILTL